MEINKLCTNVFCVGGVCDVGVDVPIAVGVLHLKVYKMWELIVKIDDGMTSRNSFLMNSTASP